MSDGSSPFEISKKLASEALKLGSTDNISVVCVKVRGGRWCQVAVLIFSWKLCAMLRILFAVCCRVYVSLTVLVHSMPVPNRLRSGAE